MDDTNLLYAIKCLEKDIGRLFIFDLRNNFGDCFLKVTPTQMQIMAYILEEESSVYQKDLERVLHLRRATVSGVLKTMEKNQIIKRVIDTDDSRIKKIILHPEAKKLFQAHLNYVLEIERILKKNISKQEEEIFLAVLKKMQTNLEEVADKERNSIC